MSDVNKQLLEALKELVIDMKIAQGNMRAAAVRDSKWEGCAEAIQPRVDMAESAIAAAERANHVGDVKEMVQAAPVGWRGVIPGRRYTDKWDSARVADYNNGWNDYQHAVKSALAKMEGRPE